MFNEIELARSVVAGRPTVVLTQIESNLWDVTVGEGAATTWETLESAVMEYMDSIRDQFRVKQLNALAELSIALQNATNSGLFDAIDVHPDVINQFCDAIGEVEKENSKR
ncbi:hypothetical protein nepoznato_139 [Escherichia phage nepoznato]|uniref:Uncharacterized protein n=1 Tax=Escherichia phage nepoznato TaxID=2696431 RepID=A0A6B9WP53_9CAUD|nr:hypothetical protein JR323_gp138 [Escherichia phage nepoznato]QHR65588.1 hypothetical protein nepoznato_139 [Escherichia phage nepoznato]